MTRLEESRLGTRFRVAPLTALGAVLGAALLLAACGGGSQPQIVDESGEAWQMRGKHCVRVNDDGGPVRRVINRTDPELCGRTVKVRSRDYVRVIPPPGMRSR